MRLDFCCRGWCVGVAYCGFVHRRNRWDVSSISHSLPVFGRAFPDCRSECGGWLRVYVCAHRLHGSSLYFWAGKFYMSLPPRLDQTHLDFNVNFTENFQTFKLISYSRSGWWHICYDLHLTKVKVLFCCFQRSYSSIVPPLLFGVFPIIGCLLCLLLPETMNTVLPDTIQEGEACGKPISK